MMKDKEWLKDKILKMSYIPLGLDKSNSVISTNWVLNYINQLDEPEITEEQAWNKIAESYPADAKSLAVAFEHFYYEGFAKKELPVIPQFVADWIEECKEVKHNLYGVLDFAPTDVEEWLFHTPEKSERVDLIALAWLDDYEAEKEKLYRIKFSDNQYASRFNDRKINSILNDKEFASQYTEAEIKAIDKRFWDFAEEVTE